MIDLGPCESCGRAAARVTWTDGMDLCGDCTTGALQELLATPDIDDADLAIAAMLCSWLIASHDLRDHIVQIPTPGIAAETFPRLIAACLFHGLHVEIDVERELCEVHDPEALAAWVARCVAEAEAKAVA